MKKKFTIATVVSLSMVPMLMPSQEASALPVFARKYGTSCYTCHAGMPARNAFGEAFRNNGYRWPGGEDEEKSKQEQTKLGSDGWKKTFPESPWPADIPGFAPFAIYLTGPLVNYTEATTATKGTAAQILANSKKSTFNWNGPVDARILFGGTVGNNLGILGAFEGFSSGKTVTNLRATWSFAPGINLGLGNGFSAFSGNTWTNSIYSTVFPASGTSVELNYIPSNKLAIIAGTATALKDASGGSVGSANKIDDTRYLRLKYKPVGAGLLNGSGGTYGNEFVGLDNSISFGASVVGVRGNSIYGTSLVPTSQWFGESVVYGADVSGNYGSFSAGAAYSRDRDLKLNNFAVDAGYFVYPWLLARVKYTELQGTGIYRTNQFWSPSLTAWLRANVSLSAAGKVYSRHTSPATNNTYGVNNADTFTITAGVAF